MKSSFNAILKTHDTIRNVAVNFTSLGIMQATNLLLPIIIYPYLYKTIGSGLYGSVAFGLNIMIYLSTLTDYSYNATGTKDVSINRNNKLLLSQILSLALCTKIILLFVSLLFLLVATLFIERFAVDKYLYFYSTIYIIGNALFPSWFYQGIEKIKYLAVINTLSRLFSLILIYVIVKEPKDYIYIIGILGSANFVTSIVGIYYITNKWSINIYIVSLSRLVQDIIEGFPYFVAIACNIIINNTSIITLTFIFESGYVGKYSISERIVFIIWQLLSMFSQATYPPLSKYFNSNKEFKPFFTKTFPIFFTVIFFICLFINLYADLVAVIFTNDLDSTIINSIKQLSFLPVVVCLNIPATQILLLQQRKKVYSRIYIYLSLVAPFIYFFLAKNFAITGLICGMYAVQIAATSLINYFAFVRK